MALQTTTTNIEAFTSGSTKRVKAEQVVVFGIAELVEVLRHRLVLDTKARNLRKTAAAIGISHPWLAKFRDGHAVCMGIVNSLANHYQVKYQISNFDSEDLQSISWEFPDTP